MLPEHFLIDKGIVSLQEKLSLPTDFFKRLLEEDDWSFIIKLHALIEAACTDLLLHHFDEPSLKNIISRLELSDKAFGKLAFIKELELLGDTSRRYISSLSEWRNNFVHNVQNCSASLEKIVAAMALRGLAACLRKLSRSAWEHLLNSMCATAASRGRCMPSSTS